MTPNRPDDERLKLEARRRAQALRNRALDDAWAWLLRRSGRQVAPPVAHTELARQFR